MAIQREFAMRAWLLQSAALQLQLVQPTADGLTQAGFHCRADEGQLAFKFDHVVQLAAAIAVFGKAHGALVVLQGAALADLVLDQFVGDHLGDRFFKGRCDQDAHAAGGAHAVGAVDAGLHSLDLGRGENHFQVFVVTEKVEQLVHGKREGLGNLDTLHVKHSAGARQRAGQVSHRHGR